MKSKRKEKEKRARPQPHLAFRASAATLSTFQMPPADGESPKGDAKKKELPQPMNATYSAEQRALAMEQLMQQSTNDSHSSSACQSTSTATASTGVVPSNKGAPAQQGGRPSSARFWTSFALAAAKKRLLLAKTSSSSQHPDGVRDAVSGPTPIPPGVKTRSLSDVGKQMFVESTQSGGFPSTPLLGVHVTSPQQQRDDASPAPSSGKALPVAQLVESQPPFGGGGGGSARGVPPAAFFAAAAAAAASQENALAKGRARRRGRGDGHRQRAFGVGVSRAGACHTVKRGVELAHVRPVLGVRRLRDDGRAADDREHAESADAALGVGFHDAERVGRRRPLRREMPRRVHLDGPARVELAARGHGRRAAPQEQREAQAARRVPTALGGLHVVPRLRRRGRDRMLHRGRLQAHAAAGALGRRDAADRVVPGLHRQRGDGVHDDLAHGVVGVAEVVVEELDGNGQRL
mmetsp:Transcript_16791/g.50914  ORF Transcript_16791/g.50914 Transcript_16791/m.50914 type:complete len:463 (-) Transcript_16791:1013-2401(-)